MLFGKDDTEVIGHNPEDDAGPGGNQVDPNGFCTQKGRKESEDNRIEERIQKIPNKDVQHAPEEFFQILFYHITIPSFESCKVSQKQ